MDGRHLLAIDQGTTERALREACVRPGELAVVRTGVLAALIDQRNQAPKGNLSALLIGLVVAVIGVNAGYAINPARDFGPRLFAYALGWGRLALPEDVGVFTGYWWILLVGPLAGGPQPEPGRIPEQAARSR